MRCSYGRTVANRSATAMGRCSLGDTCRGRCVVGDFTIALRRILIGAVPIAVGLGVFLLGLI